MVVLHHVGNRVARRVGRCACTVLLLAVEGACGGDRAPSPATPMTSNTDPVAVVFLIPSQSATVGTSFAFDATRGNTTFSDPRGTGLTYTVAFSPVLCGLSAASGRISGVPLTPGPIAVLLTATDGTGRSASQRFEIVVAASAPIVVASANQPQGATVGSPFDYDATQGGTTFRAGSNVVMTYAVSITPAGSGLSAVQGRIVGVPVQPGVATATVVATDVSGNVASNAFPIAMFGADLVPPIMPAVAFAYSDASAPLPAHYRAPGGGVVITDNMPTTNPTSDAGAALGRVLFYDRRMSRNDRVSCASCHHQQFAFSDTARLSRGFAGGTTGRHSMALANARFYQRGRFFWDERAATLEAQVLQPIQDSIEMGLTLPALVTKLSLSPYYPVLFSAAFGTPEISADRIARAIAQFVRSMVSGASRFDQAFGGGTVPNFPGTLTADELAGQALFNGVGGCARCHATNGFVSDNVHNTGLDAAQTDVGAGGGRFKAPSLKNIAVRPPYMHDGRFQTLEQVVAFYNNGVQANANLDIRLRGNGAAPLRLNLTVTQRAQLVAFMRTLTDASFLSNPKFSDPFAR